MPSAHVPVRHAALALFGCASDGVWWWPRTQDGEPVSYITSQGEELLTGVVLIDPNPNGASGILCSCCSTVISCSQFEAHAGRGSRRAPYDNIFTAAGVSLRKQAAMMPVDECESPTAYRAGAVGALASRSAPARGSSLSFTLTSSAQQACSTGS